MTQGQGVGHTSIQKALDKSSGRNGLRRKGPSTRAVSWMPLLGQALTLLLLDWKAVGTVGGHTRGLGAAAVY